MSFSNYFLTTSISKEVVHKTIESVATPVQGGG